MQSVRKQVGRILAVGSAPDDRVFRMTRGTDYVCCLGTKEEHDRLQRFCLGLEELLRQMDRRLSDFSPEELQALLLAYHPEAAPR